MFYKFFVFIGTVLFIFNISSQAKPIDEITFMTENYPPFNFKHNNKVQGISVDLILLMLQKLGGKQTRGDIHILPWARAYASVLEEEKTAIFAMTRTKKREKLFKWVGPISDTTIALIARKDRHIKINSVKDINDFKLGVVRDDIGEQLLHTLGVDKNNIESTGGVDAIHKLLKMLDRNRFDLFSYEFLVASWEMKKLGFDVNDYEMVYKLSEAQLYFAFHKNTPDSIIVALQKALDELKKEKKYEEVIQKYR
ncbi:MAG: transporter substrate-binding domain-containing protein [Campylobacteraceae bacterium]|nr:transporter substrate-binding domain-containing protein [Campylobacteraceae bacterium]